MASKEDSTLLIAQWCKQHKLLLGTAESCTAGRLASSLTCQPGASEWFAGGIIAYSIEQKKRLLGLPGSLFAQHDVVSAEVAEAMALSALHLMEVDIVLSSTGYAGPSGGTDKSPIGTIWAAVAFHCPDHTDQVYSFCNQYVGSREEITDKAVNDILFRTFAHLSRQVLY